MSQNIVHIQMMPNTRRLVITSHATTRVVKAINGHPDGFSGHHEFGFDKNELIAAIQNTMAEDPEPQRMESFMYLGKDAEVPA